MMETINELKEKIHFYKLTIQDMKEHYGEFEMETNQEIKDLKHEIEALNKEINKGMTYKKRCELAIEYIKKLKTYPYLTKYYIKDLENILKGEKNDD